jgi:hypothetical protein
VSTVADMELSVVWFCQHGIYLSVLFVFVSSFEDRKTADVDDEGSTIPQRFSFIYA